MEIDFTMTAMCRPELVRRTLESFDRHLDGVDMALSRIFVNVDPLPDRLDRVLVLDLIRRHFGMTIDRCPELASFPAAVKWCYSQPATQYTFALEDDWELLEPVDVEDLVREFSNDPPGLQTACVNLRAYPFSSVSRKLFLSPGLWKTSAMRAVSAKLNTTSNPEWQMWPKGPTNPFGGAGEGWVRRYFPVEREPLIIRDIGRGWLADSGYQKNAPSKFTTWERKAA